MKKYKTLIQEFEVIKPENDLETIGQRLRLSFFGEYFPLETIGQRLRLSFYGEYCPAQSMRSYSLLELLSKPENYRVAVIIQQGQLIEFVNGKFNLIKYL